MYSRSKVTKEASAFSIRASQESLLVLGIRGDRQPCSKALQRNDLYEEAFPQLSGARASTIIKANRFIRESCMRELDIRHSCFSVFRVFRFHRPGNICDTCNTSPVVGVIRARAYTSIREVLLQMFWVELPVDCKSKRVEVYN